MNKFELVFNIYKDEIIKNKEFRRKIKEKYEFSDIVISNLIALIVNYQIKKYGQRKSNEVEIYTRRIIKKKCECKNKERAKNTSLEKGTKRMWKGW